MKSKAFKSTVGSIAVLLFLAVSIGAQGQNRSHKARQFSGAINAYSPQTTSTTGAITGPYEIRGPWALTLKRDSTKADFSAALNMEFSDGWVLSQPTKNFDPTLRSAHTHHIALVDADVTQIPNGFRVSGMAVITLNGGSAPVSPTPLVIDITGGTDVEFSNITLTFGVPGSNHFGTAPLTGVVRNFGDESGR